MAEAKTQHERQVVGALILPHDAPLRERTVAATAERTGLSEAEVQRTLVQLSQLEPPLVHRDVDVVLGIEFWVVINLDAHEAFEPKH